MVSVASFAVVRTYTEHRHVIVNARVTGQPRPAGYEQGRMHHIGSLPQLEDQMTNFTSDFDREAAGYSPDRLDALVWAVTELLVKPMSSFGVFEYYRQKAAEIKAAQLVEYDEEDEDEN